MHVSLTRCYDGIDNDVDDRGDARDYDYYDNYYDYYNMIIITMKKRIMIIPTIIITVCWYADIIGKKVKVL